MTNKIVASFLIFSISFFEILYSQNVGINPTGAAPNSSAGLDVDFTDKGLLIPRMTTAQRNTIASPALGLQIFNTTTNCLEIYISSTWQSIYCGCTIPSAPTANAASGIAQTSFTANWTASAGATAYYLDVATDISFTALVYNNVNAGAGTSFNVTALTCNTAYYYRVRAYNTCGTSANSNIITQATSSCVCVPGSTPVTFSYTGSSTTWIVPAGVNCINVDAKGGQGADATGQAVGLYGTGGLGARVQSTNVVTPGETIYIYVGGSGSAAAGGWNGGGLAYTDVPYRGGGGGGASDVRRGGTSLADRIVVAGGGGGGGSDDGHDNASFTGGNGGNAGLTGTNGANAGGGIPATGGGGGTGSSGGSAGSPGASPPATAGTLGVGGNGSHSGDDSDGGGGGGGYYGGGGGGSSSDQGAGGGGGGSSISTGTGITYTSGFQTGNGQVIITW